MPLNSVLTLAYLCIFFVVTALLSFKIKKGLFYINKIGTLQILLFSMFVLPYIQLSDNLPRIRSDELLVFLFLPCLIIVSKLYIDKKTLNFLKIFATIIISVLISIMYAGVVLTIGVSIKDIFDAVKISVYAIIVLFFSTIKYVSEDDLKRITNTIILAGISMIVISIIQYATWPSGLGSYLAEIYSTPLMYERTYLHDYRVVATSIDPNIAAQILSIVFSIVLAMVVNGIYRFVNLILLIGIIGTIILTGSRTGIIAILVVLAMMTLSTFQFKGLKVKFQLKNLLFPLAFIIVTLVILSSGLNNYASKLQTIFEQGGNVQSDRSFMTRITVVWPQAISVWLSSPIWGLGPPKDSEIIGGIATDNGYLYTLVHFGLVGLIVLTLMYLTMWKLASVVVNHSKNKIVLSLAQSVVWSIVAMLIVNISHPGFLDNQTNIVIATLIGITLMLHRSFVKHSPNSSSQI